MRWGDLPRVVRKRPSVAGSPAHRGTHSVNGEKSKQGAHRVTGGVATRTGAASSDVALGNVKGDRTLEGAWMDVMAETSASAIQGIFMRIM